jgi:hypothetical protein
MGFSVSLPEVFTQPRAVSGHRPMMVGFDRGGSSVDERVAAITQRRNEVTVAADAIEDAKAAMKDIPVKLLATSEVTPGKLRAKPRLAIRAIQMVRRLVDLQRRARPRTGKVRSGLRLPKVRRVSLHSTRSKSAGPTRQIRGLPSGTYHERSFRAAPEVRCRLDWGDIGYTSAISMWNSESSSSITGASTSQGRPKRY